ncbi:MAG: type II toxin-antitoxin system RelE/ParE family toxin [Rhodocyclaceae bacterium]|nr:type II toxin-antitoxin system RelE/ParE family toxin [Rhodocyclaceae bacterium]MDP2109053.1 type II toxin-antitoxin system RelE/ParE family toxin [Rhodocyclaceae bacterium]MDP2196385.1 type II toxin-antitoxin system RelE/ParE family toxin [Rhodocyclaceae bacterium]MDP3037322.1 type II toxin-antitoxin system RelE/ParE family toxin [Rhodocyclaceae bacterium]
MKLEPELHAEFMAEAQASHRPASQVLRELMREFVERQRAAVKMDEIFSQAAARLADHPQLGRAGRIPGTRDVIPHKSYCLEKGARFDLFP